MAYEEFQAAGAELVSVSTDTASADNAWHRSWPMLGEVRLAMLADPAGAMCRAFGSYLEDERVCSRATFVVDLDGGLQADELHASVIGRTVTELLGTLNAERGSDSPRRAGLAREPAVGARTLTAQNPQATVPAILGS